MVAHQKYAGCRPWADIGKINSNPGIFYCRGPVLASVQENNVFIEVTHYPGLHTEVELLIQLYGEVLIYASTTIQRGAGDALGGGDPGGARLIYPPSVPGVGVDALDVE